MGNWKMKMTMCPGKGTTPPRKRKMTMSRPRRTRRQGVSYALGHLTKTTTVGTLTMEPTTTMAPQVMMVPETMAATTAAAITMAMLAWFLQSNAVDSQAPTGGSVSVDVSSR
jgi:hypothetical protein